MPNNIPTQIASAITLLAHKVAPLVRVGFGFYLRQAYIFGIEDLVAAGLCFVTIIVAAILFRTGLHKGNFKVYNDAWATAAYVSACVGALFLVALVACVFSGIPLLINPGYAAIRMILHK